MRPSGQQGFVDQRDAPGRSEDVDDDAESDHSDHGVDAEDEGLDSYGPAEDDVGR